MVTIKRKDEDTFIVEVANGLIAQPFHKSEYGNMLKYISNYIKQIPYLSMTDQMFKRSEEYKEALPLITKTKKHKVIIPNQETLF
jgi:hypothetical protein